MTLRGDTSGCSPNLLPDWSCTSQDCCIRPPPSKTPLYCRLRVIEARSFPLYSVIGQSVGPLAISITMNSPKTDSSPYWLLPTSSSHYLTTDCCPVTTMNISGFCPVIHNSLVKSSLPGSVATQVNDQWTLGRELFFADEVQRMLSLPFAHQSIETIKTNVPGNANMLLAHDQYPFGLSSDSGDISDLVSSTTDKAQHTVEFFTPLMFDAGWREGMPMPQHTPELAWHLDIFKPLSAIISTLARSRLVEFNATPMYKWIEADKLSGPSVIQTLVGLDARNIPASSFLHKSGRSPANTLRLETIRLITFEQLLTLFSNAWERFRGHYLVERIEQDPTQFLRHIKGRDTWSVPPVTMAKPEHAFNQARLKRLMPRLTGGATPTSTAKETAAFDKWSRATRTLAHDNEPALRMDESATLDSIREESQKLAMVAALWLLGLVKETLDFWRRKVPSSPDRTWIRDAADVRGRELAKDARIVQMLAAFNPQRGTQVKYVNILSGINSGYVFSLTIGTWAVQRLLANGAIDPSPAQQPSSRGGTQPFDVSVSKPPAVPAVGSNPSAPGLPPRPTASTMQTVSTTPASTWLSAPDSLARIRARMSSIDRRAGDWKFVYQLASSCEEIWQLDAISSVAGLIVPQAFLTYIKSQREWTESWIKRLGLSDLCALKLELDKMVAVQYTDTDLLMWYPESAYPDYVIGNLDDVFGRVTQTLDVLRFTIGRDGGSTDAAWKQSFERLNRQRHQLPFYHDDYAKSAPSSFVTEYRRSVFNPAATVLEHAIPERSNIELMRFYFNQPNAKTSFANVRKRPRPTDPEIEGASLGENEDDWSKAALSEENFRDDSILLASSAASDSSTSVHQQKAVSSIGMPQTSNASDPDWLQRLIAEAKTDSERALASEKAALFRQPPMPPNTLSQLERSLYQFNDYTAESWVDNSYVQGFYGFRSQTQWKDWNTLSATFESRGEQNAHGWRTLKARTTADLETKPGQDSFRQYLQTRRREMTMKNCMMFVPISLSERDSSYETNAEACPKKSCFGSHWLSLTIDFAFRKVLMHDSLYPFLEQSSTTTIDLSGEEEEEELLPVIVNPVSLRSRSTAATLYRRLKSVLGHSRPLPDYLWTPYLSETVLMQTIMYHIVGERDDSKAHYWAEDRVDSAGRIVPNTDDVRLQIMLIVGRGADAILDRRCGPSEHYMSRLYKMAQGLAVVTIKREGSGRATKWKYAVDPTRIVTQVRTLDYMREKGFDSEFVERYARRPGHQFDGFGSSFYIAAESPQADSWSCGPRVLQVPMRVILNNARQDVDRQWLQHENTRFRLIKINSETDLKYVSDIERPDIWERQQDVGIPSSGGSSSSSSYSIDDREFKTESKTGYDPFHYVTYLPSFVTHVNSTLLTENNLRSWRGNSLENDPTVAKTPPVGMQLPCWNIIIVPDREKYKHQRAVIINTIYDWHALRSNVMLGPHVIEWIGKNINTDLGQKLARRLRGLLRGVVDRVGNGAVPPTQWLEPMGADPPVELYEWYMAAAENICFETKCDILVGSSTLQQLEQFSLAPRAFVEMKGVESGSVPSLSSAVGGRDGETDDNMGLDHVLGMTIYTQHNLTMIEISRMREFLCDLPERQFPGCFSDLDMCESDTRMRDFIRAQSTFTFVAFDAGTGHEVSIVMTKWQPADTTKTISKQPHVVWIHTACTDARHRRKGYMTWLMQGMMHFWRNNETIPFDSFRLTAWKDDVDTQRLYQSLGFAVVAGSSGVQYDADRRSERDVVAMTAPRIRMS